MSSDSNNPFTKLQFEQKPQRTTPQPPPLPRQPVILAEEEDVSGPDENRFSDPKMIENAEELYDYFRYLSLGNASLYDRYKILKELCAVTQKIGYLDEQWENRNQIWSNSLTEYEDALIQKIRGIPNVPFWNHSIGRYNSRIVKILKGIERKSRYSDWKALYRHFHSKITSWWVSLLCIFCAISVTYGYITIEQNFQTFTRTFAECQKEFQDAKNNFQIEHVDDFLADCREIELKVTGSDEIPQFMNEEKKQKDAFLADLLSFVSFAEKCKICAQKERDALEEEAANPEKLMPESDFLQMCAEGEKLGQKELVRSFSEHREEIQELATLESEYRSWKAQDSAEQETVERLKKAKTWVKLMAEFQLDFCTKQFEKDSKGFQKSIVKILQSAHKRFEKKIPIKSNESKYDYEDRAKANNKQIQEICTIEEEAGFSLFAEEFNQLNESLEKAKKTLTQIQNE